MLSYRTFRNTDPPLLTALWRSRRGQVGLMQPVSVDLFEQFIFGKLYFDYHGLILAMDDGQAVGFAHAGFGPNESLSRLSTQRGVVCVLIVRPELGSKQQEIAAGLLARCEEYLQTRGAEAIYGGAVQPLIPFYSGLYGGGRPPGVLDADALTLEIYRAHGYEEIGRTEIFCRDLEAFRPMVDRQQMQFRRQMSLEMKVDPPSQNWWEACTAGDFDLTRFEIVPRGSSVPLAAAVVRSLDPGAAVGNPPAVGVLDLQVDAAHRRQGLGTFLLGEAFRQLAREGIATVEVQVREDDQSALGLCRKLGMQQTNQGHIFRKTAPGPSLGSP
jgi:ribosomal protein S18 acetylase RimI-like enzyme